MVADRALVEKFGFVLPSLNGPHSGCPLLAQPFGSRARASRSANPSGVAGQPRASAIGRGMAMTSGVSWMGLASAGAIAGWPWSARRWLTTAPHEDAAGDQITGPGAFVASSAHPVASRSAAAPVHLLWAFAVHPR